MGAFSVILHHQNHQCQQFKCQVPAFLFSVSCDLKIEISSSTLLVASCEHYLMIKKCSQNCNVEHKEVYRRNTIYKNSYCKGLIILFIWLIAFFRCSQLFLCENPLAQRHYFFLPKTFKSYKEKILCLLILKR